jgi:hypothetical protein
MGFKKMALQLSPYQGRQPSTAIRRSLLLSGTIPAERG